LSVSLKKKRKLRGVDLREEKKKRMEETEYGGFL
jgi:hypothetical protein